MKLIHTLLIILITVSCALTEGVYRVTSAGLNIRRAGNANSAIVDKLKKGQYIYATSITNGWAKFYKGYVNAKYITRVTSGSSYVTNSGLNFRTGPSIRNGVLRTLKKGTSVNYFGRDPFTTSWAVTDKGYANAKYLDSKGKSGSSSGGSVTGNAGFSGPQSFISTISNYAVKEAGNRKKRGEKWILPSVCIAQAALETGWGKSTRMRKANAYFGIKATSSWKGKFYSTTTHECYDGANMVKVRGEKFRAYDSLADSVADYFDLITKNSRYSGAWNKSSARACITGIKNGGYATDPNYISSVMSIVNKYNLTKYDSVVTN